MAVAVLGLNLSVAPVDDKFGSLVLGDFASAVDRVGLSVKGFGGALGACAPDGPSILVRYYMLVAFGAHVRLLSQQNCCSITYAEENPIPDRGLIVSGFGNCSAYTTAKPWG
jgi:hypothetical protein